MPSRKFKVQSTKYKVSKARGFTLVELMVVVSLLALLATVGISTYSGAQANARDSKRKADINAIADAMEANYGKFSAATYKDDGGIDDITNPSTKYAGLCQYGIETSGLNRPQYNCSSSTKPWFAPESGYPSGRLPQDPINQLIDPTHDYRYFWCDQQCDGGYGNRVGLIDQGSPPAGIPSADYLTWNICATLEKTTNTPPYYCRNARQ